jgi:IclR family pca regulon transcriptional regulator
MPPRRSERPAVAEVKPLPVDGSPHGRYFVEALGRGLALLDCFIQGPPRLSLGEMSDAVGVNRGTTFRLLRTLQEMGYVYQDAVTKQYSLTLKMLDLQEASLAACEFPIVARPHLEQLSEIVHESASMGILDGTRVRYVVRVASKSILSVNLHVGSLLPAHATSMGKVLLAGLDPKQVRILYSTNQPLQAYTSRTIRTRSQLIKELASVAQAGYALNDEELEEGLRSAAAPVRGSRGSVVAAINVSTATARISHEKLLREIVPQLVRSARAISRALGYREDSSSASA